MKLYRSLIYRELKLTRKRFLLMLILFLLFSLLMMTPMMLGVFSEPAEPDEDMQGLVFIATFFVALIGGLLAGTNNGLQKADINSGWKRYSFILPATAKQQAVSDLLVKLCYILLFGLLSAAFAWIYNAAADYSTFRIMLNVYFGTVCAVMLIDIAYSYIMMFANDKNQLKIIGVIAFVGAGVVFRIFGLFPGMNKIENPAEGGAMISEETVSKVETILCSKITSLCIFAVFIVLCALFFLAMWRSHERREP